jgi:hypothetical protein
MASLPAALKHAVGIGGVLRYWLAHIPVFDNFSRVEPEDVDNGYPGFIRLTPGVNVQNDEVAIGKRPV